MDLSFLSYLIVFILGFFSYYIIILNKSKNKQKSDKTLINNSYEESFKEQLNRNYSFFGKEGMELIRNSAVAIFGCNDIGLSIAVTLVRSGIKELIFIDNMSKITIDNYKYHPFALIEDIGKYNIDLIKIYFNKINSFLNLDIYNEDIYNDNMHNYFNKLNKKPDYIIDNIQNGENISIKCKLINYATNNQIKYITFFNPFQFQSDPTLIRHSKFSLVKIENKIYNDIIKQYKKLYNEQVPDIQVIYSIEVENDRNKNNNNNNIFSYNVISDSVSSFVLCDLAKFEINKEHERIETEEIKIASKKLSEAIEDYKNYEIEKKGVDKNSINITYNEFYKICKAFNNKSSVSQEFESKMKLFRWRSYKDPSANNIVLLGKSEINKHKKINNEEELIEFYTKPVVERIDNILNKINE